jgi:hypothetical protein
MLFMKMDMKPASEEALAMTLNLEGLAGGETVEELGARQHLDDQQDLDDGDDDGTGEAREDLVGGIKAERITGKLAGDRDHLDADAIEREENEHRQQKDQQGCLLERHGRVRCFIDQAGL